MTANAETEGEEIMASKTPIVPKGQHAADTDTKRETIESPKARTTYSKTSQSLTVSEKQSAGINTA